MQNAKVIRSAILQGTVVTASVALLAFAMLTVATPKAMATPAIANGQPCTSCHAGSPPSAANLNAKGKKVQSGMKK